MGFFIIIITIVVVSQELPAFFTCLAFRLSEQACPILGKTKV
jgi:hypothetical protein